VSEEFQTFNLSLVLVGSCFICPVRLFRPDYFFKQKQKRYYTICTFLTLILKLYVLRKILPFKPDKNSSISLKKSVNPEIVNRYDLWVLRHKIGGAKVFVNNVQWRIRWCNAVCNTHIRIETTKHEIKLKWIITIIWTLKHIDFYFKVGK
jgi:hypothetical protein